MPGFGPDFQGYGPVPGGGLRPTGGVQQPNIPGYQQPPLPPAGQPMGGVPPHQPPPAWKMDLWNQYNQGGRQGDWRQFWQSHRPGGPAPPPPPGQPPMQSAVPNETHQAPPQGQGMVNPYTPQQPTPQIAQPGVQPAVPTQPAPIQPQSADPYAQPTRPAPIHAPPPGTQWQWNPMFRRWIPAPVQSTPGIG